MNRPTQFPDVNSAMVEIQRLEQALAVAATVIDQHEVAANCNSNALDDMRKKLQQSDEDCTTFKERFIAERNKSDGLDKQLFNAQVTIEGITKELNEARAKLDPVIVDVIARREYQDKKWGGPAHDDTHTFNDWCEFINEHATDAFYWNQQGATDDARNELVDVAALAVAAVESFDRLAARKQQGGANV